MEEIINNYINGNLSLFRQGYKNLTLGDQVRVMLELQGLGQDMNLLIGRLGG